MTPGAHALATHVQESVAALADMEQQLEATQAEVTGLGFFARGFVEKDISGATGRGFGDWIKAAGRLRAALCTIQTASRAESARTIADELPRIAQLRTYLQSAPEKINKVPAAVLKPQQRSEILQHVSKQEAGLGSLETKLQAIAAILTRAG